jgi:hypothetical protein
MTIDSTVGASSPHRPERAHDWGVGVSANGALPDDDRPRVRRAMTSPGDPPVNINVVRELLRCTGVGKWVFKKAMSCS